ncbi:MAG TPA: hypothetical protein VGQ52_05575 [Gemmatimonadaceae bacterium]|jgi:hypothetical protein|nr:hypothetical protein [Gemmatimonadaceae bacterium]
MSRTLSSTLALLILPSALAGAQVRTIDQGSFTITMNNQRIGREDFSIVEDASTPNPVVLAKATVEYRERGLRLQPVLKANAVGASTEYEVVVRGGPIQKWTGQIERNRVRSFVSSERGQSAKEFVVSVGAMVLDDDVFHQYYLLAKRAGDGPIPVIVPQRNAQSTVTVTREGTERFEIGNVQIEAQKLAVTEASGPTREVWIDAQGRVLRVAIPSRGIVATRDEPPPSR